MNKLKIALICTEKLPVPPIAGGAVQLYIDGILPYLSRKHEITLYSIKYPGLEDEEIKDKVRYIRVPGKTEALYYRSLIEAVKETYDLIHIFNRPKLVLTLGDIFPKTKFSLSLHNEMLHQEKISDSDALRCVERVEFINTVSKYIADEVKTRIPIAENKLRVVYSGVDPNIYQPAWSQKGMDNKAALKEKYGLSGKKVVLYVGRLSIKKGVHVLINAMKKLFEENPETALFIVGSKWYGGNEKDDYTNSLYRLAQDLSSQIIFTGFVPPSEIPPYYNIGDVFVCSSQWKEPLARVHYEAMAAGLPIITTNRGGNAEVVEGMGNGIVIDDYSNPIAIYEKIRFLLNNAKTAQSMGEAGRELALKKFNWKRVADEVLGGEFM